MLLRRYIGKQLAAYYGQSADAVVGGIQEPLSLSSLWGRWHWLRLYQRLYRQSHGQWLTPVELFQPWYSRIIANYIIETCDCDDRNTNHSARSIDIVEFGGGRGTHARHVMDHLQATRPDLYQRVASYRIIDASPSLHAFQQETLFKKSTVHAAKYRFTCQDLLHVAERRVDLLRPSENLTILVALEVLDNLPHDKIRIRGKHIDQAIVRRTTTSSVANNNCRMEEVFVPLDDALIQRVLDLCPSYQQEARYTWIPTVICGVLDHVRQMRPNLHVLLADFDWLPRPDTPDRPRSQRAYGEPLVTDMNDVDQTCYLSARPSDLCDILFPTDFEKLADFVDATMPNVVPQVQKQSDFLQTYGPEHVTATKSWLTGFSPMLGDFSNCSVLTTQPVSKVREKK